MKKIIYYFRDSIINIKEIIFFFFLLNFFFINEFLNFIAQKITFFRFFRKIILWLSNQSAYLLSKLDKGNLNSISQQEIIRIAVENMRVKFNRTAVTVGGMSLAISMIVFLVSVGYGLQDLVISRVSRLEEMKQADVNPADVGNLFINDESLNQFRRINQVESVYPIISLVGKIEYKESSFDVVLHGVTTEYLQKSSLKPFTGEIFTDQYETMPISASEKIAEKIDSSAVKFKIDSGSWIKVRDQASNQGEVIGYTKTNNDLAWNGNEVDGDPYTGNKTLGQIESEDGNSYGKWIKAEVPLWTETSCQLSSKDCVEGKYVLMRDNDGEQTTKVGYFAQVGVSVVERQTDSQTATTTKDSDGKQTIDDQIKELTASSTDNQINTEFVKLNKNSSKKIIINSVMAQLLNELPEDIVGKNITLSIVVTGDLINDKNKQKIESIPEEFTVVGVINNGKNGMAWLPFSELRSLGISNYSSARIDASSEEALKKIRSQIENMGYKTSSVADTVARIKGLFGTIRVAVGVIGMAALAVAALGMFNTLTVSLLERTREVGVMKAIGMKSREVRDLFLAESMIMGFLSGFFGLILGFISGKLVSLILSFFSLTKGQGWLDITALPIVFVLLILFLSIMVGFMTGSYPANRAKKISALNALRYE
ncbi:MAG: ABC transporter permease [Patescibacteria group bacterium]